MNTSLLEKAYLKWRLATRVLRLGKTATKALGPLYRQNHHKIEIDITYKCNLKCLNCNRSCRQAPGDDAMTAEQIEKFIRESVDASRRWRTISLMGGEPALHPRINEIAGLLLAYRDSVSPETAIHLVSNGCGTQVKTALAALPEGIRVHNTRKESAVQAKFYPFNAAPADHAVWRSLDFGNGCCVCKICGLGLSKHGYYHCGVAGGIDRVLGLDLGRKRLPSPDDQMMAERRRLCMYCGRFRYFRGAPETAIGEEVSPSWRRAYERYAETPPSLSSY